MKGRKQALRDAIANAGPHTPEYDKDGNTRFVRNLECHHCDVLSQQMTLMMRRRKSNGR
jgi:hypothetical protein